MRSPIFRISAMPAFLLIGFLGMILAPQPTTAAMLTEHSYLTDEQKELLIPSAREKYDEAEKFADRGNYLVALKFLTEAFAEQDDHAEMNFLLANLATYRARQTFGKESVEHFETAEKALKANLKIKKLTFDNRQRTEKKLESLEEERDRVPERDNKRTEIGRVFIREQLIYRGIDLDAKKKQDEKEEKEAATSGASSTVPAPPTGGTSPFVAPSAPFAPAAPADSDSK